MNKTLGYLIRYGCALAMGCAALLLATPLKLVENAQAATPITTDSRIKTLVYNPNEVFNVTTHYGYQSNIEFGLKETIDTVSVGDRVAWQIIPAGRRLFIRAMEENAHTNMTIVTNQRAYQFDLRSSSADAVFGSAELTYVVRFYYPEDASAGVPLPVTYVNDIQSKPIAQPVAPQPVNFAPAPAVPLAPVAVAPVVVPRSGPVALAPAPSYAPPPINMMPQAMPMAAPAAAPVNYRYTFSGPNDIAPVKIYDDGRSTYFKFRDGGTPQVAVITAKGEALEVPTRRTADGLLAVDLIAPRFSLKQSGRQVVVYNESNGVL